MSMILIVILIVIIAFIFSSINAVIVIAKIISEWLIIAGGCEGSFGFYAAIAEFFSAIRLF